MPISDALTVDVGHYTAYFKRIISFKSDNKPMKWIDSFLILIENQIGAWKCSHFPKGTGVGTLRLASECVILDRLSVLMLS